MAYLIVRHTVEDYGKWKPVFDQHGSVRKAAGSKGVQLLRSADNPNDVTMLFEWDSLEHARAFTESPDLRAVMQRAGVVGRPDISFLEGVEQQAQ